MIIFEPKEGKQWKSVNVKFVNMYGSRGKRVNLSLARDAKDTIGRKRMDKMITNYIKNFYKNAGGEMKKTNWGLIGSILFTILFWTLIAMLVFGFSQSCRAAEVNMSIIQQIESSNNPNAHNISSGARGLYQLREIAWRDVHNHYPALKKYKYSECVFDPEINELFAKRYFTILGKYLRHYKIENNLLHILISYNWGPGRIKGWHKKGGDFNKLPDETQKYYEKYISHARH